MLEVFTEPQHSCPCFVIMMMSCLTRTRQRLRQKSLIGIQRQISFLTKKQLHFSCHLKEDTSNSQPIQKSRVGQGVALSVAVNACNLLEAQKSVLLKVGSCRGRYSSQLECSIYLAEQSKIEYLFTAVPECWKYLWSVVLSY